jgi:NTP pyrophosphatase (non-canonical NTP hydrolase)
MNFEQIEQAQIMKAEKLGWTDTNKEFFKLIEEVGELARYYLRQDTEMIIDSIGDIILALIALANSMGLLVSDCVEDAFITCSSRQYDKNGNKEG